MFAAVLAAETAVFALAYAPSSEALWYINLKLFGLFQRSYYIIDSYTGFSQFEFFYIALATLLLGCLGVVYRHRLLLAVSSNLSFVYAGFLFYSWVLAQPRTLQASLIAIVEPTGPDQYLIAILLGSSLLSFFVSHFIYARSVRIGH